MKMSTRLPPGLPFHLLPELLPGSAPSQGAERFGSEKVLPHLRSVAGVATGHRTHREDGSRRQVSIRAQLLHKLHGDNEVLMLTEVVLDLLEELYHLLRRLAVDPLQRLQGVAQPPALLAQVVEFLRRRVACEAVSGPADL